MKTAAVNWKRENEYWWFAFYDEVEGAHASMRISGDYDGSTFRWMVDGYGGPEGTTDSLEDAKREAEQAAAEVVERKLNRPPTETSTGPFFGFMEEHHSLGLGSETGIDGFSYYWGDMGFEEPTDLEDALALGQQLADMSHGSWSDGDNPEAYGVDQQEGHNYIDQVHEEWDRVAREFFATTASRYSTGYKHGFVDALKAIQ